MRRRCWSCVRKLRSETSEARTRQDLLEPSARKTTMQLVFQKRHPAVKRWKNKKDEVTARLRGTGEKGLVVVLAEAYLSLCARICLPASAGLCSLIAGGEMANLSSALFIFCFHPILCVVIVQGRMWWTVVLG